MHEIALDIFNNFHLRSNSTYKENCHVLSVLSLFQEALQNLDCHQESDVTIAWKMIRLYVI